MTRSSVGVAAVLIVMALATRPGLGQTGTAPVPRTPWGHPNLQGTWDIHTITPP
jgi:hypothetical protein